MFPLPQISPERWAECRPPPQKWLHFGGAVHIQGQILCCVSWVASCHLCAAPVPGCYGGHKLGQLYLTAASSGKPMGWTTVQNPLSTKSLVAPHSLLSRARL